MLSPEQKRKRTATTTTAAKNKKKPSPTPQSTSIMSLPHDLLLSCLARVSRLYYPTLSLVSKSFRSLLASPELYKTRSLLGHTESCLYVCMHFYRDRNPTWFTLCRKPDQTLTNAPESSGYVLAKVPIPHSPRAQFTGLVAVGSSIYNIGGSKSSSSVSILDCTSHKWREAPSFRVELLSVTACVVDRKIYVAGCYEDDDDSLKNTIEVLDTKTGIWDHVPCSEAKEIFYYSKSACIDGKFHVKTGSEVVAYNPKEARWDLAGRFMLYSDSFCEIDNVLYSCFYGAFRWYDTEVSMWRYLNGLVGLPKFPRDVCVRLADYGGKMVVLWVGNLLGDNKKMIWCAQIALDRLRKSCEIWGLVEWFDHVLTLPLGYDFVKVLAATL